MRTFALSQFVQCRALAGGIISMRSRGSSAGKRRRPGWRRRSDRGSEVSSRRNSNKSKAEPADTDPKSPMEKRLLGWLKATEFFQRYHDQIELRPQFPIGEHLRQLDPNYNHPKFRVDFLLIFTDGEKPLNIVIEYDGFEDHFTHARQVSQANWAFYYKPEDIERQMTLESYGYKFLRVNRFNLGKDPVFTLSARLNQLVDSARSGRTDHAVVDRIRKDAEALANGDKKFCRKCENTKPLKAFFDKTLKNGKGGYGRYCLQCKMGWEQQMKLVSPAR